MARNHSRMKGAKSMLQATRGYMGGLILLLLLMTGCGPSAVCTSDSECQERFGTYSACILSGDRGLCYVDEEATEKSKRDDVDPLSPDAGDVVDAGDGGMDSSADDGGQSSADAGPGNDGNSDAGVVDLADGGTTDAGAPEEMPVPPQIDVFESDRTDFFIEDGVLLSWQVSGADACTIFQGEEAQPLNGDELNAGSLRFFPTQSVSYTLECSHTLGENTATTQSEAVVVTPYPAVEITALRANEASGTLRINAGSTVRFDWSTQYADSCFWSWQLVDDDVQAEARLENEAVGTGEISFDANAAGTFRLRCIGNGPEANAAVTIELASISTFDAQSELIAHGEETMLQWTLENSEENCEIYDGEDWMDVTGDSHSVSPDTSTSYQLRCEGAGGVPLEATTHVRVLRIESFSATAESIRYGQEVTLSWQSHEAESCELLKDDSPVFTVPNEEVASGQVSSGTLLADTNYMLRCREGDVVVDSDEIRIVIEVTITEFSASIDPSITDTIRLSWMAEATRETQRCSLDGFMGFLADQVDLQQSDPGLGPVTTYTLTCYGAQGVRSTDQKSVKVIWGNSEEGDDSYWENVNVVMGNLAAPADRETGLSIFQSLRDVGGRLDFQSPAFETLSLPHLQAVYGGMRVAESTVLQTVDLPQLSEVVGELDFNGNSILTTVNVPNLTKVEGNFRLNATGDNAVLHMDSLERVSGELELSNSQLDSLAGFGALSKVEGGYMRITSNPGLSCAEIDSFYCGLEPTRPSAWINDNESGSCSLSCSP